MAFSILAGGLLITEAILAASFAAQTTNPATLKAAAGDRLLIGTAAMSLHLANPKSADFITSQFSALTPENEMKPDQLQPRKGEFTFENADKFIAFSQERGVKLIGHTLVWHNQSPRFLFEDADRKPLSREAALANMKAHILAVAGRYKGKIHGWDVVNEALSDSGSEYLRSTPALKAIGDDYLVKAFEYAHEADPAAELYYNDYNIETGSKAQKVLRLVRELKEKGAPITGVGLQGHFMLNSPAVEEIEKTISALHQLGMKVMITELDVDPLPRRQGGGAEITATEREGLDLYKTGLPPDVDQKLADRYEALFTMFARHPEITRVTFWGLDDGHSWLNNFPVPGRTNHPLLFDREGKPKAAFDAVMKVLKQR